MLQLQSVCPFSVLFLRVLSFVHVLEISEGCGMQIGHCFHTLQDLMYKVVVKPDARQVRLGKGVVGYGTHKEPSVLLAHDVELVKQGFVHEVCFKGNYLKPWRMTRCMMERRILFDHGLDVTTRLFTHVSVDFESRAMERVLRCVRSLDQDRGVLSRFTFKTKKTKQVLEYGFDRIHLVFHMDVFRW